MIKIKLTEQQLSAAKEAHFYAVCAYISGKKPDYQEEVYNQVCGVMPYDKSFEDCKAENDWQWLRQFILADVETLRNMIQHPEQLQFRQFKDIYSRCFCAGAAKYVDEEAKYNAYSFIENMGVKICPYCEEEYLDVIEKSEGGKLRTLELDHFFPKGDYPGLAMCFYNLVPSGQACNGIKLNDMLGMSPYEADIEACTKLYPDLPLGVNMESVSVDDCIIKFHPTRGMKKNVEVLCLEQRYERHKPKAHRYLRNKQFYSNDKLDEMIRMGWLASREQAFQLLYDLDVSGNHPELLDKLKRDILDI